MIDDSQAVKKPKFKSKSAIVVSKAEIATTMVAGQEMQLEWTIQNKSSAAWPEFPEVRNFADFSAHNEDLGIRLVEKILQPNEETKIQYLLKIPADFSEPMCTLKLHLVDPQKDERFGDAMIAFVNIKKAPKVPKINLAEAI